MNFNTRTMFVLPVVLVALIVAWTPVVVADVDHSGQLVVVVAKEDVEPEVNWEIDRLQSDLQNEGYSTKLIITATNNAQDLWNILSNEYADPDKSMVGALLIGNLPNGRCNQTTDAAYWNMDEYCRLSEFHIWVSRIKGSVNEIKWAMDAHHYYRTGQSRLPFHAEYLMDAYPDMESYYYPNNGGNALDVWPQVQKAVLPSDWFGRIFGCWKYGAEMLDETMHGASFKAKVRKLAGHPCQSRFNMITSCSAASAAWSLTATRGGGAVLSVGATATTYTGAFVILRSRAWDTVFRQDLAQGESFGSALVQHYVFDDRERAMYYGDLSLPVMASETNSPPVVDSFSADQTTGHVPFLVQFDAEVSDPDNPIVLHEWFCEGYRQNGKTMQPQYSNTSLTQTHTYQLAHRYLAEFHVMDQFRARAWAQPVIIKVNPTPGTAVRINCGHTSRYAVAEFDYTDNEGNLWLHDQDYLGDGTWGWSANRNETNFIGGDIVGTERDPVFAYYRKTRDGSVTYRIPMQNGRYKVTLGFAEPSGSVSVGGRLIDVSLEDELWLSAFDIVAHAGASKTATTTEAIVELNDGELTLVISPNEASPEEAVINNIVIEPDECAQNCNDGTFCNGMEICQPDGTCGPGAPPCVEDELPCTITCDEQSHGCNVVQPEYCLIEGTCVPEGSTDPENPCRICLPHSSANSWSSNDGASCDDGLWCNGADICAGDTCVHEDSPCADDGVDCTQTCDEDSARCNVVKDGYCLIDNVCHMALDESPDNICLVCAPEISNDSWSSNDGVSCDDGLWCDGSEICIAGQCEHRDPPCDDDGIDCTDTCDESNEQCNKLLDGWCLISQRCYAADDTNPDNECQVCSVGLDPFNWTNENGLACSDGNACTGPDVCLSGVCEGEPITGCCDEDADCDDGNECTSDVCNTQDGTCSNELLKDHCLIGDLCIEANDFNPLNQCERCVPATDPRKWTPLQDGDACDDDLFCTVGETCLAGACQGGKINDCSDDLDCTVDSCDETQDICRSEPADGWCTIEGRCVKEGTSDLFNQCLVCNPEENAERWFFNSDAACDDENPCTQEDTCVDGVCTGTKVCDDSCPCENDDANKKIVGRFGCACDSSGKPSHGLMTVLFLLLVVTIRKRKSTIHGN